MKSIMSMFAAISLTGCVVSGGSPEQSMIPAAGDPPIYSARTPAEYDVGKVQASDWCRLHQGVPARYATRTVDTVRFECVHD